MVCNKYNDSEHVLYSKIFLKQEYEISIYLKALYNSVQILPVPNTNAFQRAVTDCRYYVKPRLDYNQHSAEQKFPEVLNAMSFSSVNHQNFHVQWKNRTRLKETSPEYSEPLFYYLQINLYYVILHTYKSSGQENWDAGLQYFKEVSELIVKTPKWISNMGTDFISPASHPMSGPMKVHPTSLGQFLRQTFLRTDFDFTGHTPKDIIIPYYISPTFPTQSHTINRTLLFFAGGDNPPGGLRSEFEASFLSLQSQQPPPSTSQQQEVFFAVSSQLSADEYNSRMASSDFCLMLRGDTASSKRLFSAVSCGCIPVIVSDWIPLPFEALIDYSQFSLRFSESSFRDVQSLLNFLRREVLPARRAAMRAALQMARSLLLFQTFSEPSAAKPTVVDTAVEQQLRESKEEAGGVGNMECFLLNPVTLTLIEAFIRRKKYCDDLSLPSSNIMCVNLYSRLASAISFS